MIPVVSVVLLLAIALLSGAGSRGVMILCLAWRFLVSTNVCFAFPSSVGSCPRDPVGSAGQQPSLFFNVDFVMRSRSPAAPVRVPGPLVRAARSAGGRYGTGAGRRSRSQWLPPRRQGARHR